jgi:hypothetical protein
MKSSFQLETLKNQFANLQRLEYIPVCLYLAEECAQVKGTIDNVPDQLMTVDQYCFVADRDERCYDGLE